MKTKPTFADTMSWGAATASYQIEGAVREDGRGPSIWDTFCERPGKVWQGQNGHQACDHYHRWEEDVELMSQLGLRAYRFSLAWSRILPLGRGPVNEAGLAFYDRLVDGLLQKGITPWITLFHWDYPQALQEQGGWMHPDSPQWFGDYTEIVVKRLGDRVRNWITINEPQVFLNHGWIKGIHAPGWQVSEREALRVIHNVNRSHGQAVRVIRQMGQPESRIGIAPVGCVKMPREETPECIEAARRDMFEENNENFFNVSWYIDPLFFGRYPEAAAQHFESRGIPVPDDDWDLIREPIDFLGVNIYSGTVIEPGPEGRPKAVHDNDGQPLTHFYWTIKPQALYWGPRFLYERYGLPIVITENGLSSADRVDLDGKVRDFNRIDYLRRYLLELRRAHADGVAIDGYFQWSLMDNFEWAQGYKHRFGLVHVDYPTGQRTVKESAHWYKRIIESNGAALDEPV